MGRPFKTLFSFLVILSGSLCAQTNQYDLSPGTIRYYSLCKIYGIACVAMINDTIGIETVIADTVISGKTYAVVEWKRGDLFDNADSSQTAIDYLRYQDGMLYRRTAQGDSLIMDFRFEKGDSLAGFFPPENNYLVNPPPTIIYDTTVTFADQTNHRVLWGDDTLTLHDGSTTIVPDIRTFVDSVLIFTEEDSLWLLPFGSTSSFYPYKPFYFVDGLGILYAEWNYRRLALVGVQTVDGRLYGHRVGFLTALGEEKDHPVWHFALKQNYPNPFNPVTVIEYFLGRNGRVQLSVYNTLGQQVKTLLNRQQRAGRHFVVFRAGNLPSGIYLYTLTVNGQSQSKKMLYLR